MQKSMETPCKTEDDCPTPTWCRGKDRCPKRDAKETLFGGSERRLVRRCRWCGMVDCGTTGGNDHGSGFVDRSDKCKLYEAMACYVKAREEVTALKATLENLRNIVTVGNESKESFIRRVNAILYPSNA